MATAKKATAKKTGTAMTSWDEELARRAEIATKTAESTGGTSKSISTRGGQFTIDGAVVPGGVMNVVVLDFALEDAYYGSDFDADNIKGPVAFAIGRDASTLEWHENSTTPEDVEVPFEGLTKDHPLNKWGTADKGKGKAVKNTRRLMLINENDLDDIPNAEHRMLKIPVTSGKAWDGYVKQLKETTKRPPLGVLTEIRIVPDAKHQFHLQFKFLGLIEDGLEELLAKADAIESDLFAPYEKRDEEDEAPARGASKAMGKGKAPAKAPAKPAPRRR